MSARDRTCLGNRTTRWTIGNIYAREFERPAPVVTLSRVELCAMVGKGELVSAQELIKSGARGVELFSGLGEPLPRKHYFGEPPSHFGIIARQGGF